MTDSQRQEWNEEFGIPEYPYLIYKNNRELSPEMFETFKQEERDKRKFFNNKFSEIFYKTISK
jgi:hypothetical protein